jgi:hypothetical protein
MLGRLWAILRNVEARFRTGRTVKDEISGWTVRQNAVDAKCLPEAHHDDDEPPNSDYTKESRVGILPKLYQPQEIMNDYASDTYLDVSCKCIVTQAPQGTEIIVCCFLGFKVVKVELLQDRESEGGSWVPCRGGKQSSSCKLLEPLCRSNTTAERDLGRVNAIRVYNGEKNLARGVWATLSIVAKVDSYA